MLILVVSTMAQYSPYLLLLPLATAMLYMLIIALKKQTPTDQFFSNYDTLDKDILIQKLEYLEQLKGLDLSSLKERIQGFKKRHIAHFASEIDEALANFYFDHFEDNWIPFRKANWMLKLVFFFGVLSGFYAFGYIIYTNMDEVFNKWVIIIPIMIFPLSFLLSILYIMFLSIILTFFRFFAPKKGSVVRSCILFNRMIRATAPGKTSDNVSTIYHIVDFLG